MAWKLRALGAALVLCGGSVMWPVLGGCSSGGSAELHVEVVTDLVPGHEIASVRVERFGHPPAADETASGDAVDSYNLDVDCDPDCDLAGASFRAAGFVGLEEGTHHIRVTALGPDGAEVLEVVEAVEVRDISVTTVVLDRDCRGTDATDCAGPACTEDAECSGAAECGDDRCVEGTCLAVPRCQPGSCDVPMFDRVCEAWQWCAPDTGCELKDRWWAPLQPASGNPENHCGSGVEYGAGKLFFWGGVDGCPGGNEVHLYDAASNDWEQATERSACITDADVNCPDGCVTTAPERPIEHQTFQQQVWHPEREAFCVALEDCTTLWCYRPGAASDAAWEQLGSVPDAVEAGGMNLTWDGGLGKLVSFVAYAKEGRPAGAYVYDSDRGEFVPRPDLDLGADSGKVGSEYAPDRREHLVYYAGTWLVVKLSDEAGDEVREVELPAEAPQLPDPGPLPGFEYHPPNGLFYVTLWDVDEPVVELWSYDPGANEWASVEMGGEPPRMKADRDMLEYDPDRDLFFLLDAGNEWDAIGGMYVFRL